jgi:hypothetical protein
MICLRIPPSELRGRAHARFGDRLRRAGSFAQLTVLGAAACLEDAGGSGTLGLLWTSSRGAFLATRSALAELRSGELMPYTFIATQPHLAAPLFAEHVHPLARSAFVQVEPGQEALLETLARAWSRDCERVLIGQVEESAAEAAPHRSDWRLLGAISSSPRPA